MTWFAIADRDGVISVVDRAPTDVVVLAVALRRILLDVVRQLADLAGNQTMVVPGFAEAESATDALKATIRFSGRLQRAVDAEGAEP